MAIADRLRKLRQKLLEKELEGILISQPENCRYLSGFTGSTGFLLVTQDTATVATDFIGFEQAKAEVAGLEVVRIKGMAEGLAELIHGLGIRRLGFEADNLVFSQHSKLSQQAAEKQIQLIPTEGLVESLRAVKEEEELACLMRAAGMADSAMEYIAREIRPGMSEKEAAWELEKFLREKGSEAVSFEIIVASGPKGALPHARPTERRLSQGEPIVVDLGARVGGYCSDLSRTLCLGPRSGTFAEVYDLVLRAQLSALDNLEVGMAAEQGDNLARKVIQEGGYGEAFGHGLGHGVGLAVHERPRLGPKSTDVLQEGMVFTVEPGIYVAGWGGVRTEDTVMMKDGRAKALTRVGK
ncbi:MAG: M24 family metallopeptidase [Chloroflexi bacterium]|nr:M24 family metallopeptidase [Chloroflexota bacterium]